MDNLADPEPIQPDAVIYRVGPGFAVRLWDGDVVAAPDDLELLLTVAETCCDLGSRYSAKRLTIGYKPGDKHHDLHPEPCSECECECDPPIVSAAHSDA